MSIFMFISILEAQPCLPPCEEASLSLSVSSPLRPHLHAHNLLLSSRDPGLICILHTYIRVRAHSFVLLDQRMVALTGL